MNYSYAENLIECDADYYSEDLLFISSRQQSRSSSHSAPKSVVEDDSSAGCPVSEKTLNIKAEFVNARFEVERMICRSGGVPNLFHG